MHVARAERALGHPLPLKAVVHHADGSKDPNAPLVICENQAYHRLLHMRMRIKAAGGNPNTDRICRYCRALNPIGEFVKMRQPETWHCLLCSRAHSKAYKARLKAKRLEALGA
jgi:hypothetical protein